MLYHHHPILLLLLISSLAVSCVSDRVIPPVSQGAVRADTTTDTIDAPADTVDGARDTAEAGSVDAAGRDAAGDDAADSFSDSADASTSCDPQADYATMPRPNDGLSEAAGDAGCPAGMVRVDDYCIDRYEASLIEVRDDGSERSWSPFFNPAGRRVRAVSIAGAIPQGYITAEQAEAACALASKRLCTDTEWLRACQGQAGTTFPYGSTRMPGLCNDARDRHPVVDYFETGEDWIWSELGNACINQQESSVATTGEFEQCVSEDGVFDMMGNLHEWTADPDGTFRGGFYADTERNGPGCLYRTTAHNRQHWDYSTGFRCCADAEI